MTSQISRIILSTISILVISVLVILSPWGTKASCYILGYFYELDITGVSGSLWSNQIHILTIKTQDTKPVLIENIHIRHPLTANKSHIQIGKLSLQNLNFSSRKDDSSLPTLPRSLQIDQVSIDIATGISPITIQHLKLLQQNSLYTLNLQAHNQHIGLQYEPMNPAYKLTITLNDIATNLFIRNTGNDYQISSMADSHIKNIEASYNPTSALLSASIKHIGTEILDFDISANLSTPAVSADIRSIYLSTYQGPFQLSGKLNSEQQQYNIEAKYIDSTLKSRTISEGNTIISASLDNLEKISPHLKGNSDINLQIQDGQYKLYAYAPELTLPIMKLTDLQLSYDSHAKDWLYVSATQLRNPLLAIDNPSLKIQQNGTTHNVTGLGLQNDIPQQLLLNINNRSGQWEVMTNKFLIGQNRNQQWSLSQKAPAIFNKKHLQVPSLTLSKSSEESMTLSGEYNFLDHSWVINSKVNNLTLRLNSQNIVDSDTEIILNHSVVNGESHHYYKNNELKILGDYQISDIDALLLNIVPNLTNIYFPLDYHIKASHLVWHDGEIQGLLNSPQGQITLSSNGSDTFLTSKSTTFEHEDNKIQCAFSILNSPTKTTGEVDVFDLQLSFDPVSAYQVLPRDIHMSGGMMSENPTAYQEVELLLRMNATPANILGFSGNISGNLHYMQPRNGDEVITGKLSLKEPMVHILTRQIKLDELSASFNQSSWLDGIIHLSLQKNISSYTESAQSGSTKIIINVDGPVKLPSFNINTDPGDQNKAAALTQLFLTSPHIDSKKPYYRLVEIISGLEKNATILTILQALNNLNLAGIRLEPNLDSSRSLSANLQNPTFNVSKQLYDKIWVSVHPNLGKKNSFTSRLSFQVSPKFSLGAQYTSQEYFALNLFFDN
ncbi:translocation/assembly module TamB [Candidatus Synchoanobacter obligatus]|uniref:Translocation/assembly module TamB n=1 Tax=Candidatus Synchoanobacter obligatus TaxID=2919597 RepID=A0ABT1L5S4_9GAMM|nr:translocation/assembly module TamB [Candidatus Synchoanobacter obligatus]MCP8352444.1 translocation/assembly module TamB [Candidatus Synchoanobacter obligatus]